MRRTRGRPRQLRQVGAPRCCRGSITRWCVTRQLHGSLAPCQPAGEQGQGGIDWPAYQEALDAAFHAPQDAYPVGSEEHDELLTFIPRLHKIQTSGKAAAAAAEAAAEAAAAPPNPEAERLGIPSDYNPRYRVNCSVVGEPRRLKRAAREADRVSRDAAGRLGG
jgi:hypothetical protein